MTFEQEVASFGRINAAYKDGQWYSQNGQVFYMVVGKELVVQLEWGMAIVTPVVDTTVPGRLPITHLKGKYTNLDKVDNVTSFSMTFTEFLANINSGAILVTEDVTRRLLVAAKMVAFEQFVKPMDPGDKS